MSMLLQVVIQSLGRWKVCYRRRFGARRKAGQCSSIHSMVRAAYCNAGIVTDGICSEFKNYLRRSKVLSTSLHGCGPAKCGGGFLFETPSTGGVRRMAQSL